MCVCGGGCLCLMLVFISITLCHPSFVISLMGGGGGGESWLLYFNCLTGAL